MRFLRMALLGFSLLAGCNAAVQQPAAVAPDDGPEARYLVDGARGRVWTLTREGLYVRDIASAQRRYVELRDWISVAESHAAMPAMIFAPGGDLLVTSNILPVIWRVDPRTLAVHVHRLDLDRRQGNDFGFTSLTYSARDAAYMAMSETPAGRWRIDASLTKASLQ
jgi:hypothetical protein